MPKFFLLSIYEAEFLTPLFDHFGFVTVRLLNGNGKPFVDHALELALSQPLAQVNADGKRKSDDDDGFVDEGLVFEVHDVSLVFLG